MSTLRMFDFFRGWVGLNFFEGVCLCFCVCLLVVPCYYIRLCLALFFFCSCVCVCASQRADAISVSPANLQKNTSRHRGLHKIHKKEGTENTILIASFLQPPQYSKRVSLCAINNNSEPPGCWRNTCFRIGLTWRSSRSCCINPSLQDVVVDPFCGVNWKRQTTEGERGETACRKNKTKKKATGQGDEHTYLHTRDNPD